MERKNIVFSTVPFGRGLLDKGNDWNPFPAMPTLKNLEIHKLYLFIPFSMRKRTIAEAAAFSLLAPHMVIVPRPVSLQKDFSPESIGDFYAWFNDFFEEFPFQPGKERYYFHFAPGNSFSHSFMFTMLINLRKLPIRLLQLRPDKDGAKGEIYDCDINTWVSEIGRRDMDRTDPQVFLKSSIETKNTAFNLLIDDIEKVATSSSAPIMLSGPTGSGKSRLARRIYELRHKRGMVTGQFVEVNCSTLRGETALSTLFGHVRGAYTGAVTNRRGFVAQADKGILFLDEIGELSHDMQALLLKVIEEKTFIPFGADNPAYSDFQIISATNRDLNEDCQAGRFRLDLLSRINLWEFHLPSLAERPEDIEPNLEYELRRLTASRGIVTDMAPDARKIFLEFAVSPEALWPGNFRSLAGSIERMATYATQGQINAQIVKKEIAHLKALWKKSVSPAALPLVETYAENPDQIDHFDKIQLEGVLDLCLRSETRSKAGQALFNVSRKNKKTGDDTTRLRKYLQTFGIDWQTLRQKRA